MPGSKPYSQETHNQVLAIRRKLGLRDDQLLKDYQEEKAILSRVPGLSSLPSVIGRLQHSTYLDLSFNSLSTLPNAIGELTQLISLSLIDNKLETLPTSMHKLKNLRELYLIFNAFGEFPLVICEVPELTLLTLVENAIYELPPQIAQLKKLALLDLQRNFLASLPVEIGELSELSVLSLGANHLKTLPANIRNLQKLLILNLANNQFEELPEEITELTGLQILDLYGNTKLKKLPANFGKLVNLIDLILDGVTLSELPDNLNDLKPPVVQAIFAAYLRNIKLTDLDLSRHSQLTSLPDNFGEFTQLQSLILPEGFVLKKLPENMKNLQPAVKKVLLAAFRLGMERNYGAVAAPAITVTYSGTSPASMHVDPRDNHEPLIQFLITQAAVTKENTSAPTQDPRATSAPNPAVVALRRDTPRSPPKHSSLQQSRS